MEDTSTNEIVTLQFGQQANYLATHFWNTQYHYLCQQNSPIDGRINWCQRLDADNQVTWSPRVLIYDLKNSFGALRKGNEAFEEVRGESQCDGQSGKESWQGSVSQQQEPQIPTHRYIRELSVVDHPDPLEEGEVRYWSDYSRVFYYPTSLQPIPNNLVEPAEQTFETWQAGQNLFSNLQKDGVTIYDDHLRPLLEECNNLQGLQLISSINDGWGGFTAEYWDAVRDELGSKQSWLWGLSKSTDLNRLQRMNQARALTHFRDKVTLYIPMADKPYVPGADKPYRQNVNFGDSIWSLSALQAAILDTTTLPTQLRQGASNARASMAEIALNLDLSGGRNIIEPRLQLTPKRDEGINFCPADEQCIKNEDLIYIYADMEVIRAGHEMETNGNFMPLRKLEEHEHILHMCEHVKRYHTELLFPTLSSCPDLFDSGREKGSGAKFAAALQSTNLPARWARQLQRVAVGYLAVDEREEVYESLSQIYEEYVSTEDRGGDDYQDELDEDE